MSQRPVWLRYGIAVLAVAGAILVRMAFNPIWGPSAYRLVFFFPAVVLAAWYGRLGPALVSIVLGVLIIGGVLMESPTLGDTVGLIVFGGVGLCIAVAIENMHRANRRAHVEIDERRRSEAALRASEERERARGAELQRTGGALLESEERFRSLADGLPNFFVFVHGPSGEQQFVNRGFCEYFGVRAEELGPERWKALVHPEDAPGYLARFAACLQRRGLFQDEVRLRRADGAWRWVEVWGRPRFSASGEFLGYVGAAADVHDRREADRRIKDAHDTALAANRAKDEFLAILSHELRTPLSPVLLTATEAMRDPNLPPEIRAQFELIASNVALEARLIDDLLDLSGLVLGKLALEREPLDAQAVLRAAVSTLHADSLAKDLQVTFALEAPRSVVLGDAVRLRQVFWNVLRNAVKFTPEKGAIHISSAMVDDHIEIRVRDSGIGMTPDELARAFEPFAQGDHAAKGSRKTFGGLGLGLAISRQLVERQGGKVCAESAGSGHGTTIVIRLPLASTGEARVEPSATPDDSAESTAQSQGQGRKVLVVEDHESTRRVLATLLKTRGWDVTTAGSRADAVREAGRMRFDVLVSDLGLPDGDGCDLMLELRRLQPDLIGIAVSGYGMETDRDRSRGVGFSDHLTKPISVKRLEDAVAKATAGAVNGAVQATPAR